MKVQVFAEVTQGWRPDDEVRGFDVGVNETQRVEVSDPEQRVLNNAGCLLPLETTETPVRVTLDVHASHQVNACVQHDQVK
jgi:hypothetical protein